MGGVHANTGAAAARPSGSGPRPPSNRSRARPPPASRHARLRLSADLSRHARLLVTGLLLKWGIVPTPVSNGEQAVRLAQQQGFDVIIMSMLMPAERQRAGLISYTRCRLQVLDRRELEAQSCECSGVVQQAYERLRIDSPAWPRAAVASPVLADRSAVMTGCC